MDDIDFFEGHLVPKALAVQDDLLDHEDPTIKSATAKDVLDRSKNYGRKASGGPGLSINLTKETFSVMVAGLGKMMGIDKEKNVTPPKDQIEDAMIIEDAEVEEKSIERDEDEVVDFSQLEDPKE